MRSPFVPLLLAATAPLLACSPRAAPAGASGLVVARAGGSVTFEEATLHVPAGALAGDTVLGISRLAGAPAGPAGPFVATGYNYELTPHGTQFAPARPAVLGVSLDLADLRARGLDPRTAQLFYFDEEVSQYEGVASSFDERTGTLVAAIEHFSKYVVMAQVAAAVAPGPTVVMQGTVPATLRAGAPIYLRATVVPSPGTSIAVVRVYYRKLRPAPQPALMGVMVSDNTPSMPGTNTYGFLIPASFLSAADLGPGSDLAYYAEATDTLGVTGTLAAAPTNRNVTLTSVPGTLALAPAPLNISAGFEQWLTLTATDSAGAVFQTLPDSVSVSSCPGPGGRAMGTADDQRASGIHFRALAACAGTLGATSGGDTASIPVAVHPGQLDSITLYQYQQVGPAEIRTRFDGTFTVPEGHSVDLDALGQDAYGNTMMVNASWSADPTIGSIDSTGLLNALDGAGFGRVVASVGGPGGVAAEQWFNVAGRTWAPVGTALNVGTLSSWAATGSMAFVHHGPAAVPLQDGTVLVAGGSSGTTSSATVASAERYDPLTNTWSLLPSMVTPRFRPMSARLLNGKALVAGGNIQPYSLASAELYDPSTNTWSPAGSMSVARVMATATRLSNGQVLVAGGASGLSGVGSVLASAELYDPASNTWLPAGSMTDSRYMHTATLLPSGKVLVAGGWATGGYYYRASAELYDPATNGWSPAAAMSVPRYGHTATLLSSGEVLVTGGVYDAYLLGSAERYDPVTNTWSPASPMTAQRYLHSATLLGGGKVLVAGGLTNTILASAEIYDPATNTWTPTAPMAQGQFSQTATLLANGNVLMAGGRGEGAWMVSPSVYLSPAPPPEPAIAFSGSTPYVAWHEASDFPNRIYVKHWTGAAWAQDGAAALNIDAFREATFPRLAFSGSTPFVAWQEASASATRIYVKRWNGAGWVQDVPGSLNVDPSRNGAAPAIAVSGTTPYVAWEEQGSPALQIFARRWNGTSWAQLGGALNANPLLDATNASIAVASSTPYVAFEQETAAATHAIHVKHWTGSSWAQDGAALNVSPGSDGREPSIAVNQAGVPFVVWRETLGASAGLYVAHWSGTAWVQDGPSLSSNPSLPGASPAIAFSGATPYVAFLETAAGVPRLVVKHLNGAAWAQNGPALNANAGARAFAPSLGMDGPTPYAAWAEEEGQAFSIGVKALR